MAVQFLRGLLGLGAPPSPGPSEVLAEDIFGVLLREDQLWTSRPASTATSYSSVRSPLSDDRAGLDREAAQDRASMLPASGDGSPAAQTASSFGTEVSEARRPSSGYASATATYASVLSPRLDDGIGPGMDEDGSSAVHESGGSSPVAQSTSSSGAEVCEVQDGSSAIHESGSSSPVAQATSSSGAEVCEAPRQSSEEVLGQVQDGSSAIHESGGSSPVAQATSSSGAEVCEAPQQSSEEVLGPTVTTASRRSTPSPWPGDGIRRGTDGVQDDAGALRVSHDCGPEAGAANSCRTEQNEMPLQSPQEVHGQVGQRPLLRAQRPCPLDSDVEESPVASAFSPIFTPPGRSGGASPGPSRCRASPCDGDGEPPVANRAGEAADATDGDSEQVTSDGEGSSFGSRVLRFPGAAVEPGSEAEDGAEQAASGGEGSCPGSALRPAAELDACVPSAPPLPSNFSWDWPMTVQEKRDRLLTIEREMHEMDQKILLQELIQMQVSHRQKDLAAKKQAAQKVADPGISL